MTNSKKPPLQPHHPEGPRARRIFSLFPSARIYFLLCSAENPFWATEYKSHLDDCTRTRRTQNSPRKTYKEVPVASLSEFPRVFSRRPLNGRKYSELRKGKFSRPMELIKRPIIESVSIAHLARNSPFFSPPSLNKYARSNGEMEFLFVCFFFGRIEIFIWSEKVF